MDPLAISSGPNRGEAAVLPEGHFLDFSKQVLKLGEIDREEQAKNAAAIGKLVSDEVKSKWTSDQVNYFQPQMEKIKTEAIDLFKKTNGKINPVQAFEMQQKWNKLKGEAEAGNAMWSEYAKMAQELRTKPEQYENEQSRANLDKVLNPTKYPEIKKEIDEQYGGNIGVWRTENIDKYGLEKSLTQDQYIAETSKDEKPSKGELRDNKGKIIYGKHPATGQTYYTSLTTYTPNQLDRLAQNALNDNSWKGMKSKKLAIEDLNSQVDIDSEGKISFKEGINPVLKGFILEEKLTGVSDAEKIKKLTKAYYKAQYLNKVQTKEDLRELAFPPKGDGSGSGSGKPEDYNWSIGTKTQEVTPQESEASAKARADKYYKGNIEEAKAASKEYAKQHQAKLQAMYGKENSYIAFQAKGGKDNPIITYTQPGTIGESAQYRTNGFVKKGGEWKFVGTQAMDKEKMDALMAGFYALSEEEKKKPENKPKFNFEPQEFEITLEVAAAHGFHGQNAVQNMKNWLESKIKPGQVSNTLVKGNVR